MNNEKESTVVFNKIINETDCRDRKKNYHELLRLKYNDKIFPSKKNVSQIIDYLNSKFNIELATDDCPILRTMVKNIKLNTVFYIGNKSDLNIVSYRIINDEKSNIYYERHKEYYIDSAYIYVVIETNTETIDCNCNKLNNELLIYKGITSYDIENNTDNLYLYLRLLDCIR